MAERPLPTIADFSARLSELVARGFGDFEAQLLIVPDETLQAIAAALNTGERGDRPTLMIDFQEEGNGRQAVSLVSSRIMRDA